MKIKIVIIISMIMFFSAQLVSCGGDSDFKELDQDTMAIKQSVLNKKDKIISPDLTLPANVIYKADTLRSPFDELPMSPKKLTSVDTPLQAYPLNMLRFVGTVSQHHIIFAFIMTPDKIVYKVKKGDVIGDRNGKIISILPNRLNIMEEDSQEGQSPIQRVVTLELKDER